MPSRTEQASHTPLPIRILTHNIRYATNSPFKNEKPWKDRYPLILNELQYHTRHLEGGSFINLQEVLHTQLVDILNGLNNIQPDNNATIPTGPFFAHIGVGREDGKTKGEYNPILYPVNVFKLLHFENMWLSPTPDRPSKGWDAGCERVLTLGVFEHKGTGRRVVVCNTHLDNSGSEAREKGVKMIVESIRKVRGQWSQYAGRGGEDSEGEGIGVVLTGDFNSFPEQEAYLAMVESGLMVDVYDYVPREKHYGGEVTFTGFVPDTDEDKDGIGRIDYIWIGPKEAVGKTASNIGEGLHWRVEGYAVLPNIFDDGVFCSDHRCVVGDVVLSVP